MIDTWLNQIALMLGENMWRAPVLALVAGILTSVTPCSLSSVPLIVGYVGGTGKRNTRKALILSDICSGDSNHLCYLGDCCNLYG